MKPQHAITPALIRAALSHIPAALPRDEWARVGMAIKSEFPGGDGLDLFDAWSQTAPDTYDAKQVRSTWRSIKAGGAVGIGTLLHLAQQNGFQLPKSGERADVKTPTAAELAQREQERAARAAAEKAQTEAAHAQAAELAAQIWDEARDTGAAPYLKRKGVQPYGLRFLEGWALVPLRDAAGKLWNVQRIAPEKPESGPDKLFLKGGRKSGLWHMLGSTDPAPKVLLVAEGYATAASLHEATGHPVACAFDAGNLAHVAQALRTLWPSAMLVLCGDDDLATKGNPGRTKAMAAARAVRGLVVFPRDLAAGGSDFNDMHQAQGLDAVRQCVESAIASHKTTPQTRQKAPQGANAGAARGEHEPAPGAAAVALDVFDVQASGVWFVGVEQDGKRKPPEWICSRLDVEARTRDAEGGGWGYWLTFADPLGHAKQWAMPARMLSSDGSEYRAALLAMGLRIAPSPKARNLLTQYIQTREPPEFAQCAERIGWHDVAAPGGDGRALSYVLPRQTISVQGAERIVFQSDSQMENTFHQRGTAAQWRERVAALCAGNSRLVFAGACAFAGPLLRPAGLESGGFHFRGDSSSGKTTALRVAASVWGGASFMQRWRATDNALEAIAAQHSDCTLILDELAQIDPKAAYEVAYMLANEQSKARSTRSGLPRQRLTWRLLFLSSGEIGLADHVAEAGKRTRAGQEVRMADVPADAGAGMGAFEDLHGYEGGSAFARHLTAQAQAVHGAVGLAWLHWLVEQADTLKARIREASAALAAQLTPEGASGQVERAAARFALVGAAGELATDAGLTGWKKGESARAARSVFNAWLEARGGAGNGEVTAMLRQARRFLESHGEGRFTWWHRGADDHNAKTLQRAGLRRMVGEDGKPIKTNAEHQREYGEKMIPTDGERVCVEYFVLTETFRAEVCQGFDYKAMARVLLEHGCLRADGGSHPFDTKQKLPGIGRTWCYRILPALFELDL